MKKLLAFLLLCLPFIGIAQTSHVVTFKVNTANITVGPNGLFAGGGVLGLANALQLFDPDGNGVYEGSTTLTGNAGGYFGFFNSPAWDQDWNTKENLAGLPCADPGNFNDRIMPSFGQDTTLMFCFGTCSTDTLCPTLLPPVNVTFRSDRTNSPAFTNAYLSGTFPIAWNGTAYPMSDDDGDGVYEVVMSLTPGDYRYKFTADDWAIQETFDPASMSDISCINTNSAGNTDRVLTVGTSDTTLMIHAWEECGGSFIGVQEATASFTVKPNPASDVLFIENTTGTTTSVAVYNVTGAKVMEENFEANTRLDVATLPRGMYIVRLQNEETDSVIRISLN